MFSVSIDISEAGCQFWEKIYLKAWNNDYFDRYKEFLNKHEMSSDSLIMTLWTTSSKIFSFPLIKIPIIVFVI